MADDFDDRGPRRVRCAELSGAAMAALLDGDLSKAGALTGVPLTAYFLTDRARWLWRYRLGQMAADPGRARWMVRQVLVGDGGLAVGHAGFHGPPDGTGTVEIGYSVAPAFRRRGYARSAVAELLRRAAAEPSVLTVRAAVAPDNRASLATIAGFGFAEVGEQWDEEDGRELLFEVPARPARKGGTA
ncbi:GNAT family protein [Streptomyces sp. NPDC046977]|uniref:GNAT family N-acetyltransferase n=1 Tax=Streptomyces sp. NPDC046977 TaxID=3154703 RepID=UPI0033FC1CEE